MKKMKRIAAMAAAIAVCSGTALYMPQDTFVSGVLTASAAEVVNSDSRMEVHTEDEEAFVFHVNDPVDFENKEFYELYYSKFDDVSILVYDEDDGEIDFEYDLRHNYDRFSFDMSEVDMTKAGTYPVYVTDKDDASIRTSFNITVKDWFMEVHTEDEEAFVFHVNDPVDFENKEFYELYYSKFDDVSILVYDEDDGEIDFEYDLRHNYDRFSFDMSEVDMTKAGTYPVYVTDKDDASIRTSFNITVKDWFMEVHAENEEAFVFHVNDPVDFENKEFYELYYSKFDDVSILVYDEDDGEIDFEYDLRHNYDRFSFDMSEVDMTKAGAYPVYVTDKDDASIRTSFNITVKDWFMEVHTEDEEAFVFHVNDPVDFENKEFYELYYSKFDDVSILVYDEADGEIDFEYDLRHNYDRFSFDMSEVDMTKAGAYPVYVTDKDDASIRTSFNITVKDWFMEVYAKGESEFVFHVNDDINNEDRMRYWFEGKYVRIYDADGYELDDIAVNQTEAFAFDFSEVDISKAGTYPVYVTAKKDASLHTSFNITVKDWFMEVHAEDEKAFVFHINDPVDFENEEFYELFYSKLDDISILIYDEDGRKPYPDQNLDLRHNYGYLSFDMSEVDMSKAGTYPIYVTDKEDASIRTTFEIEVVAWEMEVIGNSEKDFIFHIDDVIFNNENENTAYVNYHVNIFDCYGNKLIYGANSFESYLNTADYEIDLSKVDMSKPGTYPVTVIYKENEAIRCEFDIHVKGLYMEVLTENEDDFVYYVGGNFNNSRYDVKIYDDDKVIHSSWPLYFVAIFDTSEVDMNTPGTYTVYATHEDHPSVKCQFEIIVKEKGEPVTKVCSDSADAFTFNVGDELCLDEIYLMRTSANGNVSTIILLENCTVDTSEVDMNTPGTYTIYVSNETLSVSTEFQITVNATEEPTTTTVTTDNNNSTTTTTTTVTTDNENPTTTTTTVTTLPQTGYSAVYNYIMLMAAAIAILGGYVMAKGRKKLNNN